MGWTVIAAVAVWSGEKHAKGQQFHHTRYVMKMMMWKMMKKMMKIAKMTMT